VLAMSAVPRSVANKGTEVVGTLDAGLVIAAHDGDDSVQLVNPCALCSEVLSR
jgi:hypothetical protein